MVSGPITEDIWNKALTVDNGVSIAGTISYEDEIGNRHDLNFVIARLHGCNRLPRDIRELSQRDAMMMHVRLSRSPSQPDRVAAKIGTRIGTELFSTARDRPARWRFLARANGRNI